MKKPKIIVYHNNIQEKKVFIVVFINKPFDFDKAKEILNLYSTSKYVSMPTGLNAITFVERKENFDKPLLTTEEFKISKIMIKSLPDVKSNLYDVIFEDECSKLELDEKALKNVLRGAGIFNIRIV